MTGCKGHSNGADLPRGGGTLPPDALRYERAPAAIYAQSFETVRAEARLDRFDAGIQRLVVRLIHSCGMVEIADRLAFSPNAYAAGQAALQSGAPVLCDCEMVGAGIIRRYLPADNPVIVTLNNPETPARAQMIGNTRSAAAVELWRDHIEGAVVAIGNAPTALFHLLEMLDQGWPKPACILGFPVGFVGAAESKAELAARPRGCEFIALRGRRGGSAMASAAVNALAAGLPEERT
jgi:precorrin-8X/cobalt-precorrin-8 methylmutase